MLIPWNVMGAMWNIFALLDIGMLGRMINELGIDYNFTQQPLAAWFTTVLMDVWHWTSLLVLLICWIFYTAMKQINTILLVSEHVLQNHQ